jgi:hypothetical protein
VSDPTSTPAIEFPCPGCGARFLVARELVGRKAGCRRCNIFFLVPDRSIPIPGVAAPAAPPAPILLAFAPPQPVPIAAPADLPVPFLPQATHPLLVRAHFDGARAPVSGSSAGRVTAFAAAAVVLVAAADVGAILGPGWTRGSYGVTGTGWKFTKADKIVFFHQGGRHVGPYYGFSSGVTGKVKVVGSGYKPVLGDKATVIPTTGE